MSNLCAWTAEPSLLEHRHHTSSRPSPFLPFSHNPADMIYNFMLSLFTYRCLNHLSSTLLQSLFVLRTNTTHTDRITKGELQAMLTTPHANSRYGFFSLSFIAADRWNLLPIAIRQAASMPDFHAFLSAYLGLPVRSHRLLGDPL